jgi:hypothetical protein
MEASRSAAVEIHSPLGVIMNKQIGKSQLAAMSPPRPATYVWRAAAATLRGFLDGTSALNAVTRMYPDDQVTSLILRAASTQATLTDPAWAGPLAMVGVSQAIEDIVAMSSLERLLAAGALHVDLGRLASLTIPGRAVKASDAGVWLAEGAPSPVRQYAILGPTLRPHKLEVITVVTREMSEASNIEDVLRVLLTEAAGLAIDAGVFSTNAASTGSSAGLMNGLTPLTPTPAASAPYGFDACGQDLGKLVGDIATRGGGRRAVFIGAPSQATSIRFWAGGQFSATPQNDVLPVAASAALADGTVVCVEPESFACSFGVPEFSVSSVAALHMEDTTPADIVSGTGTLAVPVKGMFQIDALALKMVLRGDWCMRAPHVSFMDAVQW